LSDAAAAPERPAARAGTTADPVPSADARGRTFPCESCGADLAFHIGVQSLRCPYCGFVKRFGSDDDAVVEQDLHAMLARLGELRAAAAARNAAPAPELREIACDGCGATVRFQGSLTSSECGFCGVPLQARNVHDAPDRVPVDGVLPFRVDRRAARERLSAWVRSRWFAPNEFRKRGVDGRFEGTYLPYWTYDAMTDTRYTGERGEHYWVTVGSGKKQRRVRRTRWHPASGRFQLFFDDVLVLAAAGVRRERIDGLEPWPLADCRPYAPELLAGFLARTYDVELDAGFEQARTKIERALAAETRRRIGGDAQRVHSMQVAFDALTFKHLLLPVWTLAYRFRGQAYQVLVNAGTGEVQGDRPWSWVKIALAVLGVAALVGLVALVRALAG